LNNERILLQYYYKYDEDESKQVERVVDANDGRYLEEIEAAMP
jgi:hypothetical protein